MVYNNSIISPKLDEIDDLLDPADRCRHERLRLARLRRKLSVDIACERAGISRMTLYRLEAGSPAIALGTFIRVLSVLSLENDLELIAREDRLGRLLQDQKLPPRRRNPRKEPAGTAS